MSVGSNESRVESPASESPSAHWWVSIPMEEQMSDDLVRRERLSSLLLARGYSDLSVLDMTTGTERLGVDK